MRDQVTFTFVVILVFGSQSLVGNCQLFDNLKKNWKKFMMKHLHLVNCNHESLRNLEKVWLEKYFQVRKMKPYMKWPEARLHLILLNQWLQLVCFQCISAICLGFCSFWIMVPQNHLYIRLEWYFAFWHFFNFGSASLIFL